MKKRLFSFALALLVFFTAASSSFTNVFAADEAYYTAQKLTIINKGFEYPLLRFNGSSDYHNFAPSMVAWPNPDKGINYSAYCVNPAYAGYGDAGEYNLDIFKYEVTDTDRLVDQGGSGGNGKAPGDPAAVGSHNVRDSLEAAIRAGFPANSAEDLYGADWQAMGLGHSAQLEYGAYLATKMAIWALIHDSYSNPASWTPNSGGDCSYNGVTYNYSASFCQATHALFQRIYNAGMNYTEQEARAATLTAGTPEQSGDTWEIPYTIGGFVLPEKEIYAGLEGDPADYEGITFKYADGSDIPKNDGNGRYVMAPGTSEFKVVVPIPQIAEGEEYSIKKNVIVYVEDGNKVLLYAEAEPDQVQNYVLCGASASTPSATFEVGDSLPTGGTPGEPETPETPTGGDLVIIKTDAATAAPLSGVTFDVYNSKGQVIATGTTDSSGAFKPDIRDESGKLMKDTYWIIERTANNGYQYTEPIAQSILVDREGVTYTVTFRDFKSQTVTIFKEDAVTGEPVNGCEYEISQIDGKGAWKAVEITSGNGMAKWENVPDGTYMVREVSTVSGYILDPTPQYVTVRNGQAPSLKFLDSKYPGLTISKIDAQTGESIDGPATFRVEQIDGSYSEDITTSGGKANIKDMPVGSYKITELSAPAGYVIDNTPGTVHLPENASVQYNHYNLKTPILTIEKTDGQSGTPVPGTKFEIKKADGTLIGTVTTGNDGTVTVGGKGHELGYLEPGVYTATEVFVPEPYVLSGEHQDIELNGGDSKSLFFNNLEMPKIQIEKCDEKTGDKLEGAQFAIYEQHDMSRPVVEGVTDADGVINSGFVPPGTYVIKELNPPPGYMFSDKTETTRTIVAKAGDGVITVKFDNIKLPQLTLKKVDMITGKPIAGVTYRVERTDDDSFQPATDTTDANGLIVIPGLEAGTYSVTEIACPSNYILNDTPQQVKMEGGDEKTLFFQDIQYPTLIVTKINALTYEPVPNTTYRIEYEGANGGVQTLGTYRTDENGQIVLPYVDSGWYIINETQAAPGFSSASNPITRKYLAPGENSYTAFNAAGEAGDVSGNNVVVSSGANYINGQEIINYPLNSIVIRKSHAVTGEMLAGAVFEVHRVTEDVSGTSGTVIGKYTTNNTGVIVLSGLEPGGYIVEEIKAPENFLISENSAQQTWLKPDGTSIAEVTFANIPYGSILITKVDALTNKPLKNARFRVTDGSGAVAGNTNGDFVTDENGEALVSNLKPGAYVVTEIEAPQYYAVDTTPQTVNVGMDGKTYKVSFKDQPAGEILIRKLDYVSHDPLADAEFKVTSSDGSAVGVSAGVFKTDASGTVKIPNLPKGSYVIEEIKAPSGYVLENQAQPIAVDNGKTYTVDVYNKKMSGLQIIKIDSVTKQPLKGAEFALYKQSGEIAGRYTTDADGVIIIDTLEPGWYKAVETKTLDGYVLDETPKDVQITDNQFVKLVFENAPMSSLLIRKVDADTRNPLEGAEFTVTNASGLFIGIYRSGTDGTVYIPTLSPGFYTVTETKAPEGYTLGDNVQTVEITNSKAVTIEFQNRAFGSIVIKKVDEITGDPLAGGQFSVYRQAGEFVGEYTSGKDGSISIPNVEPGWYLISETKAPTGYVLDSTAKTVEVKPVVPTVVTFTNRPLSGLEIIKTDAETKAPLAGAAFVVERADGERIGSYKTDAAGKIIVSDLDEGVYVVSETIPPDGYILNETPKNVTVVSGKLVTVEFANKPKSGVQILKTDSVSNAPLAGAVFKIERANGERVGDKYTTDVAGKIIVPDLEEGVYIISEIQAPDEYVLDAQPQTVEVMSGKLTIAEFANKPFPILNIRKTDSKTGALVAGAQFTVAKLNGEVIANVTSLASGAVSIKVAPGIYVITETKAPVGYELNDPVQTIEVRADGSSYYHSGGAAVPGNTAEFANNPLNTIEIVKLDAVTHNPLSNAMFTVDKADGERIGTYRTDSSGKILVNDMAEGTYVVSEIAAPNGYILNESPKSVNVSGGKLVSVEFLNKPLSGIEIVKLDAVTGAPLQGAAFSVTKAGGESIGTYRTGADGKALISSLDEGVYVVGEISAPDGYVIDETPKNVTVKSGKLASVEFVNKPHSGIQILKLDAVTHKPLANASFTVVKPNGESIGTYKTDSAGKALVSGLPEGEYIISEIIAPDGYIREILPQTVSVKADRVTYVEFVNEPYGALLIKKVDDKTGAALSGVSFNVTTHEGTRVGDYTTDAQGVILLPSLEPGAYIVREMSAKEGYLADDEARTVDVISGKTVETTFRNRKMSGLQIVKTDASTKEPLKGAQFTVYRMNGSIVGTYETDVNGVIILDKLESGWYKVAESKAPDGYLIDDTPKDVEITSGQFVKLTFENRPMAGLIVKKMETGSLKPLSNATFSVKRQDGRIVGTYHTGADGTFSIPELEPDWYIVTETKAPEGYILDDNSQTVEIKDTGMVTLEFLNRPLSGIQILKLDTFSHTPLAGATFTVERDDGEKIGTYKTDSSGKIIVTNLDEGTYIVSETIAPDGYIRDEVPKTVVVKSGKLTEVEFQNKPLSGITIVKTDAETNSPLAGAEFEVVRDTGEKIGSYTTDVSGKIVVTGLDEGTYIVSETAAPDGYILSETPKTVVVKSGKLTEAEFTNKPLAGLKIIKLDSSSRQPIAGVEFDITAMNGKKVENDFRGYTFTTDKTGQIYIPELEDGYYTVTETRQADGYLLDSEPKTVLVESCKPTVLEVLNTPISGLLIVKTDEATGQPLNGVVFDVRHADGQFVVGSILDANQPNTEANSPNKTTTPNGDITGSYTTDANGRILINTLPAGEYQVIERKALDGYELDSEVHAVTVTPGKLATLQITNKQKAGLRILKLDSQSKAPIFGVEFMLFDAGGNVVGRYVTDNNGIIDFAGILTEGRYTIRETKAAPGYYLDETPRTIEFVSGKYTEIRWENTPEMAQIQITKLSGDENEVNGLPAGSPLADAVFEVYAYKSGNLVDRFISGSNGRAVSKPLPLGRYTVKEVQAPKLYKVSDQVLDIELEFPTQIIKTEFLNYSANTGVTIKKSGPYEAMPGDTIRWDIQELRNTSTIPLTDFYWRDTLPTGAARLTKIVTGTYSQSLKYKIMITTNKGVTRVIADNLSTTQNNVVDCSNASLGLGSDEYVTSFTLVFGTVKAGFASVEPPQIYARVLPNLPNGFEFANKVDIAGKNGSEWVAGGSTWLTRIYSPGGKLPRTGY